MKTSRYYVLVCVLLYLLTSFSDCKREYCNSPEIMDFENIKPKSEELKVDVFFDASESMMGFVQQDNSYYIRTIQIMERALISAWPKGTIWTFYKFGTHIDKIKRNEILRAIQPAFYQDKRFTLKTYIEKVIDRAKKENLTLIITDLFQDNSDVNLLISKLNEKFLKKNMAFGILGIKSEFIGKVYDVWIKKLSFDYDTTGRKANDFRPFYVLMLGRYEDIKHYYENIRINGLDSFPESNFIIFCANIVKKLASFEDSILTETSKITEVTTLLAPHDMTYHVKQFVVKGSYAKAYFRAGINLDLLPYTVEFDKKKLIPKSFALRYSGDHFVDCETALKGLKIENFTSENSLLEFSVNIVPANLPGEGTYCFKIIIRPLQEAYALPGWISNWDMNQELINKWKENRHQFKGSTTLNLKIFLNNIWQIIYQKSKPKIAKLYCYIKKR